MKQENNRIIDGVKYYRVTTILHDAVNSERLNYWLKTHGFKQAKKAVKDMPLQKFEEWRSKLTKDNFSEWLDFYMKATDRKRDNAADRGTAVHDHIFNYLSGNPVELPETDPCYIPVNEFKKWAKSVNLDSSKRILEYQLVSKKHGFTGKLDYLPLVNGVPTIIDLKTSGGIYQNYFLQVGAYWGAWAEMNPTQPIGDCMIVRVDKEIIQPPEILILPAKVMPELFDIFLAVKKLWVFLKATEKEDDRKEWLCRT